MRFFGKHSYAALLACAAAIGLRGALVVSMLASGARAAPTFTDVTLAAGLTHNQVATGSAHPMTGGVAAGDFDGDNRVDLFFTRTGGPAVLYRNTGSAFQDVSVAAGFTQTYSSSGVASGDVDNDGDLDLYVTSSQHNRFYLYVNDGAGHFTEQAVARGASVTAVSIPSWRGMGVAMGDYDGDGYLDILTSDHSRPMSNNGARLLRNMGAINPGHFQDVTQPSGIGVFRAPLHVQNIVYRFQPQFADIDLDGRVDILFSADDGTSQLFWNNGNGMFTDGTIPAGVGTDKSGMGSTLGDYDADGDLDWFVTAIFDTPVLASAPGNRLYRNDGNRTFTDVTTAAGVRNSGAGEEVSWGWGTEFFDYDNDADLDLAMTNGWASLGDYPNDDTTLRRNDGDGIFTDVTVGSGITDTGQGRGLLTFDYDVDGDLDVVIANNAGAPILYRNDGGNAADWLRIKTVGSVSNRNGIGSRITVTPDVSQPEVSQYREILSGSSFLSQSEMTAHFGLGQDVASVDRVTIRWPSGMVQTLLDVAPNQVLTAQEPLPGDFNGDGAVNGDDLTVWQNAVGVINPEPADVNGDGMADGHDLLLWQRFVGMSLPTAAISASVPESSAFPLALAALTQLCVFCRQKRR